MIQLQRMMPAHPVHKPFQPCPISGPAGPCHAKSHPPPRQQGAWTHHRPTSTNHSALIFGSLDDREQQAAEAGLENSESPLAVGQWHISKGRDMLKFMGPAAVTALADPLLSFVDAVCIGQFSGTLELAALGPAMVIFSFCQYIFGALQVTQLSLVSSSLREDDVERASRMLTCGISLALVCGVAVTLALQLGGSALIQATGVQDVACVLPLAAEYVRIRSWAQPAVLLTMVCQAGLLAQRDAVTPMLAVLCSVVVSALGNVVFVAWLGWGLVGAAVTTVATQYVCAGAVLLALLRAQQARPSGRMPLAADVGLFLTTMWPLTVSYLCKNLCYVMINTTAAGLATIQVAAHQAVFSFWNLLAFSLGPVELAALAFVPSSKTLYERHATSEVVLAMGGVIGLVSGLLVCVMLVLLPQALTRDASLWPSMASVALPATFSLLLVGFDVAATGINIALGDSAYLARSYVLTFAAVFAYMATCRNCNWGLGGVWVCIMGFFGLRALQSIGRVWWVHLAQTEEVTPAEA